MNTAVVKTDINKYIEFYSIVSDIMKNDTVLKMKNYRQHCDTDTYEHCFHVAYMNYVICKKLKLDYISAARAGMLHDLFLYDWRDPQKNINGTHATEHPKIALNNAENLFELNDKEKDIIVKHMWPLCFHMPKYKETFIITITDKLSAIYEIFSYCHKFLTSKKFTRYAYTFFSSLALI